MSCGNRQRRKHSVSWLAAFGVVAAATLPAQADFIVTPLVQGQSIWHTAIGATIRLDIVVGTDHPGSTLDSVLMGLLFSAPGLRYTSYEWAGSFPNRDDLLSIFDDSVPSWTNLPALLSADLLRGPGHPADAVDIQLSNIAADVPFSEGRLVTLILEVPREYTGPGMIEVSAFPDTFAMGFEEISTRAGTPLTIIIPGPGVAALLMAAPLVGQRRRAHPASFVR